MTEKSALRELEVGKRRLLKRVETFKDLLVSAKTEGERKKKIVDLLKNSWEKVDDKKFGFNIREILWLLQDDPDFFVEVSKVYNERMLDNIDFCHLSFKHIDLIKNSENREILLENIENCFFEQRDEIF